ncbi:hypothetical protein LCGC14_1783230 [marine sediment metagenome]|uniref:Uncharacterized protein n=1 Tax=marine sediment metagenome TaxID=412755 RepID=A0A0F9J9N9_9ZZZZ
MATDGEKTYIGNQIDLLIEQYKITNNEFVEIIDNIKIDRDWNNG